MIPSPLSRTPFPYTTLFRSTPGTSDDEPMYLPTPGTFDEALVEIGTSPVLTDDGLLVMLTNGATRELHADGTVDVDYRCGQIRSEEHPSELQLRRHLVDRVL